MKISNLVQFYNLSKMYQEITYMVKVSIVEDKKIVNNLYYYVEYVSPDIYKVTFTAMYDEKTLKYYYKLKTVHFDDFILAKEYAIKKMKKLKTLLENAKNN